MNNLLSFIIPCYGSQETILSVINEIAGKMCEKPAYDYEIITINDCSPDGVLSVLKTISNDNKRVKVIDLAKNAGKHGALMAGFKYCSGHIIICVDDDLQCPMDQLWNLLEPLNGDCDISIANYGLKKQSRFKNIGSKVNSLMANCLIDKPKDLHLSNFLALKRFVVKELLKYDKPYPYIDGLMLRTTRKIANVPMEDRERTFGNSGYTFKKSIQLWMNGFTAFSVKPLRIATVLGALCACCGFAFGIYTIIHKILNPLTPAGYSSTMAVLLFIGGMIMLMLGLIGEYIGRIYISINNSPQYVIRDTINLDKDKNGELEWNQPESLK